MASNVPSEDAEQRTTVEYCEAMGIPVFHIPNEGKRSKAYAARMKRVGLRSGVPDLMVPVARGDYHGLFIEMKRRNFTPSKLTDSQREWIYTLKANGYAAFVCAGADKAIRCVDWYMEQ